MTLFVKPLLRPPLHLALDSVASRRPFRSWNGNRPCDLGTGPRVAGGDLDDLVVAGPRGRPPILLGEGRIVVVARGLHVALHEGQGPGAVGPESLRVEDGRNLPGVQVAGPRHDLAEALGFGSGGEWLRDQDGIDLLALERLEHRGHGLERNDPHVLEPEALLLQDVADVVVKRGPELGHADALALEVLPERRHAS